MACDNVVSVPTLEARVQPGRTRVMPARCATPAAWLVPIGLALTAFEPAQAAEPFAAGFGWPGSMAPSSRSPPMRATSWKEALGEVWVRKVIALR